MKKVVRNAAFEAFLDANNTVDLGTRIKKTRDRPLTPGGRVRMTLFESVAGGRPHPRMRFSFLDVEDPKPPQDMFDPPTPPTTADEVRKAIADARTTHAEILAGKDIADKAPKESPLYWANRIRANRCAVLFGEIRSKVEGWIASGTLPATERAASQRAVLEAEAEAYAGELLFDDADTGTYHSYGKDAPFVHYLESILESLPREGSEAMALSYSSTRESIRRQRDQAHTHLDYLMRHKYAYEVIEETNIEKTLGGFLIDAASRRIASETTDSDPLAPSYELIRVASGADKLAGQWLYRDAEGGLYRQEDHAKVEVDADDLRFSPLAIEDLTFRRDPKSEHLRSGIRFDWDENGWVQQGKIDWVSWAGHCDIKAVLEQLGVTLTEKPGPTVTEFRSDTGKTTVYTRDLLMEMLASMLELGSVHSLIDGTGRINRGIHHFGGSRNDSRPDRLQFTGLSQGRSFRWPLSGRGDTFVVKSIELPDGTKADMGTVFFRYLPDTDKVSFEDNPRYLKVVEGDYNLIDVSGSKLSARIKVDVFDPKTGYPTEKTETTEIDLSEGADGGEAGRYFLGTHIDDVGERKLFRLYYDPKNSLIKAEMEVYSKKDDTWTATPLPEENVEIPLRAPLRVTLSREMKRDDPAQFTALLELALRQAENICADTDKESAVWNGVVTRIESKKVGANADARTEHWKVDFKARFGEATLEYLVRRNEVGEPEAYCPATSETDWGRWPDFLWQAIPDVCTKGLENGDWIVNDTMVDRQLVQVRVDESVDSGFYIYDDHIKNVFELLYTGLAGHTHTVVHENKRYALPTEDAWKAAVAKLEALRAALTFKE